MRSQTLRSRSRSACVAVARLDLLEQLHHPARPLAARRALPARLVHVELRRPQRELHHAAAVVDDDERRGAEERAGAPGSSRSRAACRAGRGVSTGTDEPPGMIAFSCRPSGIAAADVVDQLAHRRAELELVVARAARRCRRSRRRGARRDSAADLRELGGAQLEDDRHGRDRADVVDLRRRVVEPLDRRERRPRPRLAAPALERVEQRRLLAADVRAGTAVDEDVDVAEDARLARLVDRRLQDLVLRPGTRRGCR